VRNLQPGQMVRISIATACIAPLLIVHRLAIWMDTLLYPSLSDVQISRPLFIVGLPRSGTTYLHRLVASDDESFTTLKLWELLFAPAICERKLFRLLGKLDAVVGGWGQRFLRWIEGRSGRWMDSIHKTSLFAPEEDSLGLLAYGGCFLRVIAWPHDEQTWRLGHFNSQLTPKEQSRLLSAYSGLIKRHLYFHGTDRCFLSKNPGFCSWIPSLEREFDDARFIGLHRSPLEAVPSQLSSIQAGMKLFGHDVSDERITQRFLRLLADYSFQLQVAEEQMPPTRFQSLQYELLVTDSYSTVISVLGSLGFELSPSGRTTIQRRCDENAGYQSKHRYNLEAYGLSREQIASAFGHVTAETHKTPSPDPSKKIPIMQGSTVSQQTSEVSS